MPEESSFLIVRPYAAKRGSTEVQKICRILELDIESGYELVDESPEWAQPLECFPNVRRMITEKGGDMVCGWSLWETLPGVLTEAEFHAIWRDKEGVLHDVSPRLLDGIDKILFIPDSSRTYQGVQVDNLRIAHVKDPLVGKFIKLAKMRFKLLNTGELAQQHGLIRSTDTMIKVEEQLREADQKIKQKYFLS